MTLIQTFDPRSGDPAGRGTPQTTARGLEHILDAAEAAAGSFGQSPPGVRIDLLRALADRLEAEADDLCALAARETGLPLARLTGEVARTSGQLRLFAEVLEDLGYLEATLDPAVPDAAPPRPDLRRVMVALGPVLVFAASNFPFAFSVLGGDTASALACGAPVIVKAHDSHARLSARVAELATDVVAGQGLPAGVFGTIFGTQPGVDALRDRRVRAAGFTGSTAGGRALFDLAGARPDPIPFFGELGSVNPTVVTPAALAARGRDIAAGYVASFTLGTGQFCTKPGLLFLPSGHGLTPHLAEAVGALPAEPLLNARIKEQLYAGLTDLEGHPDISLLARGGTAQEAGSWATPTLVATTAPALVADPAALTAEQFGPASLIVSYTGPEELMSALESVEGSLTATVHSEASDTGILGPLVDLLRQKAGRLVFNGWPTGVAVAWAMHHGGPWPATTAAGHTSVGAAAIRRWLRPVCYQDTPDALLPPPLQDANPWRVPRRVNGLPESH